MQLEICKDEKAWLLFANSWVEENIKKHHAKSLYLPAGETPRPLYSCWETEKPNYLKQLRLIQIDDVATGPKKDLFKNFFCKELPTFQKQISFFDLGQEQAELGLLGLGLNGHVAFHEPGVPAEFFSGCTKLSDTTLKNLDLGKNTWGKTYGLSAFMKTKAILILIRGEKKKPIVQQLLKKIPHIPAATLLDHNNCTILTNFEL